jgi:two-component system OmpR family sensor kinase
MSSNPPTDQSHRGLTGLRSPRAWSLRARLLVTEAMLLAVVCVAIGAGTELAMKKFLTDQLDTQVIDAGQRSTALFDMGPPPPRPPGYPGRARRFDPDGPGPGFLDAPGQAIRTIGAVVSDGRVLGAGVITSTGARQDLSAGAAAKLVGVEPDGKPVTVHLDGLGSYRVVAIRAHGGVTVLTGLPMTDVDETLLSVGVIFVVVAGIALAVAIAAGIVIIRRQLAPVSQLAGAARNIADLDLERGEVSLPTVAVDPANAHTEVGQLASALNRMLERISDALTARHVSETRVRQFVADASHELRTPLAAIRGYTELAQRHRDVSADLAHAMSRVASEADRMTTLVEDMLLLARLDAGRPLAREQVDLSQLAVHAVADAHVAGPNHQWSLELPEQPVIVTGDTQRLQQVLVNLLANARTHTPPHTTVTMSLAANAEGALLTVADNGPGIPADLRPDIFERFARGDTSRSRRDGSTGLGLAIVAAVVKAHDGAIDVSSQPGDTTFTVHLPGSQPPQSDSPFEA